MAQSNVFTLCLTAGNALICGVKQSLDDQSDGCRSTDHLMQIRDAYSRYQVIDESWRVHFELPAAVWST